jgi:AraC family transcriptional regulator
MCTPVSASGSTVRTWSKSIALVGRGHIVVWEGAGLWLLEGTQDRAELLPHSHHAIQVTFALKGEFRLSVGNENLCGPVAAVAANVSHTFQASGVAAFLFIAPESSAGLSLKQSLFASKSAVNIAQGPLVSALGELRECYERGANAEELRQLGQRLIAALPKADQRSLPDHRVQKMIEYARSHLESQISLPAAARVAHLSDGRARHLFVAHTGLPFKTFVTWLRLERAVAGYAGGSSLTEAAHDAGFADSAHLSRTFRRTFGLPAAALRLNGGFVKTPGD